MIRLCLLITSLAFCQNYFELVKDSLNTPVEHSHYIYKTIKDSLTAINGNKVLDSTTLAKFQRDYRTDRLYPDSIKTLLRDTLGLTHQIILNYHPTSYKEGRWIWVPFVGEQKVTTSFDIEILDSKDSTLLNKNYSHTYTLEDWYCGIWECKLNPIPATEQRKIIASSLNILLGDFAEDLKKLLLGDAYVPKAIADSLAALPKQEAPPK